ncbi:hypothetical protein EJ08DRAFT_693581 [Tothia fuscella]|uniref:Uncharacterized protein n=1 Tax=Tothia fuscella TaxID=1048955 RepID=A0A9P4U1D3_9PEZI|nr:hypothetical protein EJ08DRAFT_693581 [Tothia fuscella]
MSANYGATAATHSLVKGKIVLGMTTAQLQHVKQMDPALVLAGRYPQMQHTDQPSQSFLEAADRRSRQDGLTAYKVARPDGVNNQGLPIAGDVTAFHPAHAKYDLENLPAILYQLSPSNEDGVPAKWGLPPPLLDDNGNTRFVHGIRKKHVAPPSDEILRDWETTPGVIGRDAHAWELEYYMRLDPRHTYRSIVSLIFAGDGRPPPLPNSVVNMPRVRMREKWGMATWSIDKNGTGEIASRLTNGTIPSAAMLAANSTRGHTPGRVNPLQARSSSNWIPLLPGDLKPKRSLAPIQSTSIRMARHLAVPFSSTAPLGFGQAGGLQHSNQPVVQRSNSRVTQEAPTSNANTQISDRATRIRNTKRKYLFEDEVNLENNTTNSNEWSNNKEEANARTYHPVKKAKLELEHVVLNVEASFAKTYPNDFQQPPFSTLARDPVRKQTKVEAFMNDVCLECFGNGVHAVGCQGAKPICSQCFGYGAHTPGCRGGPIAQFSIRCDSCSSLLPVHNVHCPYLYEQELVPEEPNTAMDTPIPQHRAHSPAQGPQLWGY